jgi:catechol-2,3-dioxygenase
MLRNAPIRAYIPASNITRVRKFYEEIIGLQPKEEYAGGAIYESGRNNNSQATRRNPEKSWAK